jgi:hypothetical protein
LVLIAIQKFFHQPLYWGTIMSIKVVIEGDNLSFEIDRVDGTSSLSVVVSISDTKTWLGDRAKPIGMGFIGVIVPGIIWVLSHLPLNQLYYPPHTIPSTPAQVQIDNH